MVHLPRHRLFRHPRLHALPEDVLGQVGRQTAHDGLEALQCAIVVGVGVGVRGRVGLVFVLWLLPRALSCFCAGHSYALCVQRLTHTGMLYDSDQMQKAF